jgi:Carboxypeptidase regulatory-like domain/TonB dependent receptor
MGWLRYRECEWRWLGIWLLLCLGFSAVAWGQGEVDGAIAGQVLSAAGRPVAGVVVSVRGVETGLVLRSVSGRRGEFLIARLPVGAYWVEAAEFGLAFTLAEPVPVGLGGVTEVELRMHTVPPGGRIGARVGAGEGGAKELAELPVDGGQWRSLAVAYVGANAAAGGDEGDGVASYRGVAVTQNSARLDGGSGDLSYSGAAVGAGVEEEADAGVDGAASSEMGGERAPDGGRRAGAAYAFAQGAVREFQVKGVGDAAAYGSALYGHGVGGVVTMASKRGGTALHGMGFYTVRSSAWAAVNPYAVESSYVNGAVTSALVKPADLRQQFGGSLGGPVSSPGSGGHGLKLPGKLFYFYAFDGQARKFPAVSSPGYAGFYALTADQVALLANRGVSASQTNTALNYLDSLTGAVARRADQTVNFGRMDWQGKRGSQVEGEYNRVRWSGPGAARSGAVVDRGTASLGSSFGAVDQGVGRWVQGLPWHFSNEVRVQYGRELQYEQDQTPLPQEPAVGPGNLPPEVSIGPQGLVFGTPAALGQRAYPQETRLETTDVLAWTRGRHLLQIGGDFSAVHTVVESLTNVEGTFTYDSSGPAAVAGGPRVELGGLVDWITDYTLNVNAYPNAGCIPPQPPQGSPQHFFCFKSFSQSFGQQSVAFDTQEWAGFVQDDWRVGQRLTIHAGVRYEYQLLPLPQQPNPALDIVFGGVGATSVFPEDRNNFGPRLGIAWEAFGRGRGLVKLGWGGYFGKLPGATIRAALLDTALTSSVTRVRILPTTVTACPQVETVGFGYACAFESMPSGFVAATTSAVVFDRRFRLPEVQEGTLSLEREVGWGVLAKAGYVVNLDRQLPNSVDINIAPSTGEQLFELQGGTGVVGVQNGETFAVPVYGERVSTSFGPVTDIVSNADASYNGMTLEALRRPSAGRGKGLEFRVGWTWSKAIDFGQNGGSTPKTNGQFDPFTVRYDKGLSALNFPHRVVGTVVWTPSVGQEAGWVGKAANGWTMGGIFSQTSGRGYSYDISGGSRLAGGHESINGSGGSVVLPTVGRNTLRLPDTTNLNLRVSRSFRLRREGVRLRALVEGFNVLNHVNISNVQQRAFLVGAPVPLNGTTGPVATPLVFQDAATVANEGLNVQPFGTYTGAATSQARERQVQMGLRVEF